MLAQRKIFEEGGGTLPIEGGPHREGGMKMKTLLAQGRGLGMKLVDNREQVVEGDYGYEHVVDGDSVRVIRTRIMLQQQLDSSEEEVEDQSDVEWLAR